MGNDKLRTIPVKDTDAPEFAAVARKVNWPEKDADKPSQFWPAMSGFNIGSGTDVDISYLESTRTEPSNGFDRHLNTEELFVCLAGEYVMPMAPCRKPDDPDDEPRIEDLSRSGCRAGVRRCLRAEAERVAQRRLADEGGRQHALHHGAVRSPRRRRPPGARRPHHEDAAGRPAGHSGRPGLAPPSCRSQCPIRATSRPR